MRLTGWVGWRAAIPICSFCGGWGYDRRLDHKSRMGREFHVRFREGLGVQFPQATRLKPFTELPTLFPEAVVYRWLYFREKGKEEEVLEELRLASEKTDHQYVAFC